MITPRRKGDGKRAKSRRLFSKGSEDGTEIFESGFDVLDDVLREVFRVGQVVEVGEAAVFEPKEVEAGFVAGVDFLAAEFPPATFGVLLQVPGFFADMPVGGMVAGDEVGQSSR